PRSPGGARRPLAPPRHDPHRRHAPGSGAPRAARPSGARRRPLWRSGRRSLAPPPRPPRRRARPRPPGRRPADQPDLAAPTRPLRPRGPLAVHGRLHAAAALPPPLPPRGSLAVAHAVQRLFRLFGSSTRPSSTLWQTFRHEAQMKEVPSSVLLVRAGFGVGAARV